MYAAESPSGTTANGRGLATVTPLAPVSRAAPLVGYRYDQNLVFGIPIHQRIWKASNYDFPAPRGIRHTCFGKPSNDEQSSFDFRDEVRTKAARMALIELDGLG
jgi:hypothetical protein